MEHSTSLAIRPTGREMAWSLLPLFMLRVAGLPVESVAPLRAPGTVAWAAGALDLERQLDECKLAIGDDLESAVGATNDVAQRRRLLNLRRDVFNRRLPRDASVVSDAVALLDPDAAGRLTAWAALRERYAEEVGRGAAVLAGEVREGRRYLRALGRDDRLRFGVLLASPSLDRYLPTYLGSGDGPLSKRARRIERSLLEYVFRTACKTSPFSTLTTVALGRFGDADWALVGGEPDGRPHSHTRLNLAALARLAELLVNEGTLRADLPVQVTSGWRPDNDRIRYVRRHRRIGDEDSAVTIDVLEEKLFYLSGGHLLDELLATVGPAEQIRLADLVTLLHSRDPENRRHEDVEAYLSQLLRLGLLTIPPLHLDIHHPDPVRDFRDGLARLDRPWATGLVERLDLIGEHVQDYRTADLDGRRRLLEAVRGELDDLQHDLGRAEAATPRTLIYEDVTLGGPVVGDRETWRRELLPALEGLSRILPVFDMTLPGRLTTTGFFRARYGRGARYRDVIKFVHEYQQDAYEEFIKYVMSRRPFAEDNSYVRQQNWFRLPTVTALDDARLELIARMTEARESHPADAAELVLDDDFVSAVAGKLPAGLGSLDPRSFFLQVASDGGRPLGVLNRAYSGLSLLFSRFAHCFPDEEGHGLTAGIASALLDLQPEGAVFAELTGGYETTNLNLHPAVTPYELVCPGDLSSRPASEQIPLDDLSIVDDEEADEAQLWSERLGVRVIPVYLGFLMPMALPEVQRILLTFSYPSMAALDLWGGQPRPPEGTRVVHRPRIRYRNLILQRRSWTVNSEDLPVSGPGRGEAEWFLDWSRWVRENGLPRRVFLSSEGGGRPSDRDDDDDTPRGTPLTKPQYLDFDSYFSLMLLDNVLKSGPQRLALTEAVPDLDQLWLHGADGSYVTELTVELDGVARRPR
jgi:hypothetical protein